MNWNYFKILEDSKMHERRFQGDINRLRNPERLERLEINRVIKIATEGNSYHRVLDAGT